ncbi:glycoside hydrolase domain-containing protein, partial [Streptomyces rhizosphaericus]
MTRSKQNRWQLTGWATGLAAALATAIAGATPAASAEVLPDPRPLGAKVFKGWAFDTCHAPSLATLRAWNSSRYRAVGVYYAGRGRACASQPNLTVSWMRGVKSMKWQVLPIFVGSQSPCVRNTN